MGLLYFSQYESNHALDNLKKNNIHVHIQIFEAWNVINKPTAHLCLK